MGNTQKLLVVVLVLFTILYVQSYLRPKTEYTIIQSYLDKLSVDTLYDKYPIVIYDYLQDPNSLLTSLFAYSFQFKTQSIISLETFYKTSSKFTLIYNGHANSEISLVSPKYKVDLSKRMQDQDSSVQYVTVNLKQHQIMILPIKWFFYCVSKRSPMMIMLDDMLSAMLKSVNLL